jgi:Family of unknown function (DUF6058)
VSASSVDLAAAVAVRFYALNGEHPMTAEDDDYVSSWYLSLEELADSRTLDVDELRRLMLANRLPLPSYIRSDGAQMVAKDLLDLAEAAGGSDNLPEWFAEQWPSAVEAVREWDDYLSGRYVCLRSVTPANMRRKNELCAAIAAELNEPPSHDGAWLEHVHGLVDELDVIEPPFAPYDRLRFGGPVSRDRLIDDVRRRFSRDGASRRSASDDRQVHV